MCLLLLLAGFILSWLEGYCYSFYGALSWLNLFISCSVIYPVDWSLSTLQTLVLVNSFFFLSLHYVTPVTHLAQLKAIH